jgi:hypothetical protein
LLLGDLALLVAPAVTVFVASTRASFGSLDGDLRAIVALVVHLSN